MAKVESAHLERRYVKTPSRLLSFCIEKADVNEAMNPSSASGVADAKADAAIAVAFCAKVVTDGVRVSLLRTLDVASAMTEPGAFARSKKVLSCSGSCDRAFRTSRGPTIKRSPADGTYAVEAFLKAPKMSFILCSCLLFQRLRMLLSSLRCSF